MFGANKDGGISEKGAAPFLRQFLSPEAIRVGLAVAILAGIILGAHLVFAAPDYGAKASLSLLLGGALGFVFQRGRFCFFCITRDAIEQRDATGVFAILMALAVGGIGYALVFGTFLPNSFSGRLPPDAHIGPVSWVVVVAGTVFGIGMTLSGACISGHLYRLGEGYIRAPIALVGSVLGFGLGFLSWQSVYLSTLVRAPVAWLPATLGYGGSLVLHLTVITGLGLLLLRWLPEIPVRPAIRLTLKDLYKLVFKERWNPLVTGAIVGLVGVAAYFRVEPLGVTSQLGSLARTALDGAGILAGRLNGLDNFAGCATQVVQTITENGWLIGGMVLGALAAALLANRFQLSRLTPLNSLTALIGGVLMGWGAMLALGCTVGTLLSGISAFAVSGWLFGIAVLAGVWLGLKLRLYH